MDFEDTSVVDNNYSYDGSRSQGVAFVGYATGARKSVKSANVFTAKGNEVLNQVGYFSKNTTANVTIYIYLDGTGDTDNGTLVHTQTADIAGEGYRVLNLDKYISLKPGQRFSIIVEIKATYPGETSYVVTENPEYSRGLVGQSYYLMADTGSMKV